MVSGGSPVHPRVGGEHVSIRCRTSSSSGSSPRGRGTLVINLLIVLPLRFIPAWAGNTYYCNRAPFFRPVHPRVGGEHVVLIVNSQDGVGSSPRGRGTRHPRGCHTLASRFIPAWAGNTLQVTGDYARRPVHPRVGGEHGHPDCRGGSKMGSSPRGRGTRQASRSCRRVCRFIPAWAGNTYLDLITDNKFPVHPRVGGEHRCLVSALFRSSGSSPRGRGTHTMNDTTPKQQRFIPAWAGNTTYPS